MKFPPTGGEVERSKVRNRYKVNKLDNKLNSNRKYVRVCCFFWMKYYLHESCFESRDCGECGWHDDGIQEVNDVVVVDDVADDGCNDGGGGIDADAYGEPRYGWDVAECEKLLCNGECEFIDTAAAAAANGYAPANDEDVRFCCKPTPPPPMPKPSCVWWLLTDDPPYVERNVEYGDWWCGWCWWWWWWWCCDMADKPAAAACCCISMKADCDGFKSWWSKMSTVPDIGYVEKLSVRFSVVKFVLVPCCNKIIFSFFLPFYGLFINDAEFSIELILLILILANFNDV